MLHEVLTDCVMTAIQTVLSDVFNDGPSSMAHTRLHRLWRLFLKQFYAHH